MISMDIEQLATTRITQMVARCPHLKSFITDNDKTPLIDGQIFVYSSEVQSNANYDGRVDVQVKGHKLKGDMKVPRKFPIKKTELAGHLKSNGVLYLIVYINPKTGEEIPHYILLRPFWIHQIIEDMGSQQSVKIETKPLSSNCNEIESLVRLALKTRNEQPEMQVDLAQLDNVISISVYTNKQLNLDAPVTLTRGNHDFTLVAKTPAGMMSVDGDFVIVPEDYLDHPTEMTVSSGDFVFRNPVRRKIGPNILDLVLSDGLKIRLTITGQTASGSMTLTMRETLRERFEDLGFYFASMDNQAFYIDGKENKFDVAPDEDRQLRKHFKYLTTLLSLCDELGVNSSLVELKPLEGDRAGQLTSLHGVMVKGNEIDDGHHETGRILQPMGRWNLQLIVVQDSTDGKWLCRDLFHPELGQQMIRTVEYETGEREIQRVTPYEILDFKHFPYTLNLHLDNIVNAYDEIFEYPETSGNANATVLNLIRAADVVEVRHLEFLDAALSLNRWLASKEGDLPRHQINHWQIIARKGELAQEERSAIRLLKRQTSASKDEMAPYEETSCAILLGEEEDIVDCLSRLEGDQLASMREWPIWDLYIAAKTATDA
jgi:hypothetical protein